MKNINIFKSSSTAVLFPPPAEIEVLGIVFFLLAVKDVNLKDGIVVNNKTKI